MANASIEAEEKGRLAKLYSKLCPRMDESCGPWNCCTHEQAWSKDQIVFGTG